MFSNTPVNMIVLVQVLCVGRLIEGLLTGNESWEWAYCGLVFCIAIGVWRVG
jgi:hypothetical protein